jgi:SAM-dependent methyltransferase
MRAAGIHGHLDEPAENALFASWLDVRGWALSSNGERVRVEILVNGTGVSVVEPSEPRPDVAALYKDLPAASASGFHARVKRSELPDFDTIVVEAIARTNQSAEVLGVARVRRAPYSVPAHSRGDYKEVWESLSRVEEEARVAVCGSRDSEEYQVSGESSARTIAHAAAIGANDTVLEVGCGTGRIGLHLAPLCGHWTGADVSRYMLEHARHALESLPNVSFVELNGYDLSNIDSGTLDVVYCSAVFMHLEEWDRYRYVVEMFRVLKAGGRAYFDNYNLMTDNGWRFFLEMSAIEPANRRPHLSKSSTPDELRTYAERAGFVDIRMSLQPLFVGVTGTKP